MKLNSNVNSKLLPPETLTHPNRVEKDAQLLANRIALLKQEEIRTWKKIEETKKRTKEISDLKQKNEDRVNTQINHIQHQ
jgi:hypothetical protein